MKKRYLNIVVFALFVIMLWGCSDWTKPEAEDFFEMPGNDYYENLRAYKRSEHSVAFGWFGGWTGVGASEYLKRNEESNPTSRIKSRVSSKSASVSE